MKSHAPHEGVALLAASECMQVKSEVFDWKAVSKGT